MLLDSPVCDFGWKAPEFSLADPDGNVYSVADAMGTNGLLIAFICNHCPYVQAIADRFSTDMKTLQDMGFGVLAVMSNDYRYIHDDSPRFMKMFAERYGFTFPYLVDEDQKVGRAYGAVCTPDFFGLNNISELQYRGRLDDAKMGNPQVRKTELLDAMRLIAETGNGPKHQTPSIGCSIKWS